MIISNHKKALKQKKLFSIKKANKKAHRLIFKHKKKNNKIKTNKTDIILMLNQILVEKNFSSFMQVINVEYILSEVISVLLNKKVINLMLLLFHNNLFLIIIRQTDSEIFLMKASEQ